MQKSNEAYDARELSKFNIWQYEVKLLNIADMFTKTLGRLRFLEARSRFQRST